MEHILFLTGRLAQPQLERVLTGMAGAPFTWSVRDLGLQVAALMTTDMVRRRLPELPPCDRLLLPGRCRGDVDALAGHYGIPVQRGPDELKDLPQFFQRAAQPVDLSRYRTQVFAEIVDAPRLTVAAIVARAQTLAGEGADVIDLGCLPATPFAHLEDAVRTLKAEGLRVSVDSLDTAELLRGGQAGADYLLSLTDETLWVADEVAATPVLIPRTPEDTASLEAAIAGMAARGRPFLADPILDPIPFGFTASIVRYHALRQRHPEVALMMGVGNLTELVEADTSGINALLLGIAAELDVTAVLTTSVSPHARRAVAEADAARRVMHAAVQMQTLPKSLSPLLATVHERRPYTDTPADIAATAAQIKDPNFRVQVAEDGIHVYNRDGHQVASDPFALWPGLKLDADGAHAFYMGVELGRAEIAHLLGKRYNQDQPLNWGVAWQPADEDMYHFRATGSTLNKKPADE